MIRRSRWDGYDAVISLLPTTNNGNSAFLHAGGILGEVDDLGDSREMLADGLGSVRGVTDASGTLVASADYDIFGDFRAQAGDLDGFGFTGEQQDAETGLIYLRARYYQPGLGRMLSPDRVQPNAPGTQGYNLYAYVANNTTTWVDPTGHQSIAAPASGLIVDAVRYLRWAPRSNAMQVGTQRGAAVATTARARHPAHRYPDYLLVGMGLIWCMLEFRGVCWEPVIESADRIVRELGSDAPAGGWSGTTTQTTTAPTTHPETPPRPQPEPERKTEIPGAPPTDPRPCSELNRLAIPHLSEGMARGGVPGDWGRAHIEERHAFGANESISEFWPGYTEQAMLERILYKSVRQARAQGVGWELHGSYCRLQVTLYGLPNTVIPSGSLGIVRSHGPNPLWDIARRIRIIVRPTPPWEVVTMYPIAN